MAAIGTAPTAIDRKLHRVVLDSEPTQFNTLMAIAREVAANRYPEFSYVRNGETEYSGQGAIQGYVSYAHDLGLLDSDLAIARPKKDVRSLENFQQWLSDATLRYLTDTNASMEQIEQAIVELFRSQPFRIPTQTNIREKLNNPPSLRNFRFSLKIITLLRPGAIEIKSHRIVLMDKVVEN